MKVWNSHEITECGITIRTSSYSSVIACRSRESQDQILWNIKSNNHEILQHVDQAGFCICQSW